MKLSVLQDLTTRYGDFAITYNIAKGSPKTTFVVGTTEFDNKYILAKTHPKLSKKAALAQLEKAAKEAASMGSILIFSWTKDKLFQVPALSAKSVRSLSAWMDSGTFRKRY